MHNQKDGARPGRLKRRHVYAALAACALLCAAAAAVLLLRTPRGAGEGHTVNDFYIQQERGGVSAYFFQQYGVELDSGDQAWSASYGGEVPDEVLRVRAEVLERYDEALRTLAVRYGLEPLPTMEKMEEDLEAFNRQRAQTQAEGGVIYGPEQYEFLMYYLSQKDTAETGLIDLLMDDALEHQNDLLLKRYEETDTRELSGRRAVTLAAYRIEPEEFAAYPEEASAAQQTVMAALERGEALSEQELTTLAGFPVSRRELQIDSGTISREDSYSAQLLALAAEEEAGACFLAPYASGSDYTCIYQIVSHDGSRPTFEEARMTVAAQYATERFENEIAELTGAEK